MAKSKVVKKKFPAKITVSYRDLLSEVNSVYLSKKDNAKYLRDEDYPEKEKTFTERVNDAKAYREDLKNTDTSQNIHLKRKSLYILFIFLAIETIVIYTFSFFQATKVFGFKLEEWSFKLLLSGTLVQITYMLRIAIVYLFPNKNSSLILKK